MVPIFLALQNAVGVTSHVLLPRASPHATTHLPDSYVDSIDLTVFRNDTHSTARLRTFDNYVALSAVPGASTKICILLPSDEQVQLPISTHNETTWFILLDGSQFTYADLRCTIEFDYDHSISNSMRPPELPRPPEHISTFDDNEMISETAHQEPNPSEDSESAETTDTNNSELNQQSSKAPDSCSDSPPVKSLTTPGAEAIRDDAHQSCNNDAPRTLVASLDQTTTEATQALTTHTNSHTARQPGEESQVLLPVVKNIGLCVSRRPGEESQILNPTQRKTGPHREAGEESQVLVISKPQCTRPPIRESGEESQVLQEANILKSSNNSPETSRKLEKMHVRNTSFVKRSLDQDSNTPDTSVPSHKTHATHDAMVHKQTSPSRRSGLRPINLAGPRNSATNTGQNNNTSNPKGIRALRQESPDVLHPSNPRKRTLSESSDANSRLSPSKVQKKRKTSRQLPDDESTATDTSTASTATTKTPSKRKNKRQQSLRSETDIINVPPKPIVVFSTNCTIQNKKRTMDTFLALGGTVGKDISDANMLCVPPEDGLRKTPKLILAVILGKTIVTENWVVQCARTARFPSVSGYQPTDRVREKEWGVKLPDALNQAHSPDTKLSELFAGYKLHLTQALSDQLSKTGNLEAFVQIGRSMGAQAVRKRLPVRPGPKLIVMGINDDFDAAATGRLGLALYDKDLLTMSALRGRNESDKDEFRIEIPIKEEQLSQS